MSVTRPTLRHPAHIWAKTPCTPCPAQFRQHHILIPPACALLLNVPRACHPHSQARPALLPLARLAPQHPP